MRTHCEDELHSLGRCALFMVMMLAIVATYVRAQVRDVMGDAVDVSLDFQKMEQLYFIGNRVVDYEAASGKGTLEWTRNRRQLSLSFNKLDRGFTRVASTDFPGTEYDENPVLPFAISFISTRTVRVRFATRQQPLPDSPSLMLVADPPKDISWKVAASDTAVT